MLWLGTALAFGCFRFEAERIVGFVHPAASDAAACHRIRENLQRIYLIEMNLGCSVLRLPSRDRILTQPLLQPNGVLQSSRQNVGSTTAALAAVAMDGELLDEDADLRQRAQLSQAGTPVAMPDPGEHLYGLRGTGY